MLVFFAFDVATRLVTPIDAIFEPITIPLIRNARLVRNTFKLIVVAEFAIGFIIAIRTVRDVVTSD